MGRLSYQAMGVEQRGQRERGRTTDSYSPRRWMATLKKLPHSAPSTPASAQPHGGRTSSASGPSTSSPSRARIAKRASVTTGMRWRFDWRCSCCVPAAVATATRTSACRAARRATRRRGQADAAGRAGARAVAVGARARRPARRAPHGRDRDAQARARRSADGAARRDLRARQSTGAAACTWCTTTRAATASRRWRSPTISTSSRATDKFVRRKVEGDELERLRVTAETAARERSAADAALRAGARGRDGDGGGPPGVKLTLAARPDAGRGAGRRPMPGASGARR